MSTITNTRVLISKIPEGVAPNKSHFRTVTQTIDIPTLKENEIFVKNLIFSLDPYIRHDFPEGAEETAVIGMGISKVLASQNAKYPVGSVAIVSTPWEQYSHIHEIQYLNDVIRLDDGALHPDIPLAVYNGVLGVPGFTVWDSLNRIGNLKAGETIYVSSAAGTLGQLAGQLAKRKGLRVIGSAGTDGKVAFLKNQLGFDAAFNYKSQNKRDALTAAVAETVTAGGKGLDIYYDLVGDDTTEIVLDLLNKNGRILAVGILSYHQNELPFAPKNLANILFKELRYEGYAVFEKYERFGDFLKEVLPLVAKGEIKYKQTDLKQGVETIAETYLKFLNGAFVGKVTVQIADL
ncbi:hypothetical protein EDD11_006541 [Mortierella claussenii]|nr:hypothetical protein EDD11_006541 [Mortierella claussenii]